jgi:hypothetical protein
MPQQSAAGGGERTAHVVRGAERQEIQLNWGITGERDYWIVADGPPGHLEASGNDFFEALASIRRRLEESGWLLAVQGARRDTYPSGMLRDMVGARRVYVLEAGRPMSREHLADLFADADPADAGTVEEQREHFLAWRQGDTGRH